MLAQKKQFAVHVWGLGRTPTVKSKDLRTKLPTHGVGSFGECRLENLAEPSMFNPVSALQNAQNLFAQIV